MGLHWVCQNYLWISSSSRVLGSMSECPHPQVPHKFQRPHDAKAPDLPDPHRGRSFCPEWCGPPEVRVWPGNAGRGKLEKTLEETLQETWNHLYTRPVYCLPLVFGIKAWSAWSPPRSPICLLKEPGNLHRWGCGRLGSFLDLLRTPAMATAVQHVQPSSILVMWEDDRNPLIFVKLLPRHPGVGFWMILGAWPLWFFHSSFYTPWNKFKQIIFTVYAASCIFPVK